MGEGSWEKAQPEALARLSTPAVTPAPVEVHNNVRWVSLLWRSRPEDARAPSAPGTAGGTPRRDPALAQHRFRTTGSLGGSHPA
ncbi:hypothetical protein [Microvirga sesbaniae]|uniref:hypothetical protein n=1 Tax=Microvirga sesbaniae TaxID=681392 RepID=UPI0021CA7565|nr:hypothetical protein [Microvirga sp. HBU67692]